MNDAQFRRTWVYTTSIACASALIAIGAKIRPVDGVTSHKNGTKDELIFWFDPEVIEVAGIKWPVGTWIAKFLAPPCPWCELGLPDDHPWVYLKAAAENRQNLLPAVKMAQDHPFRVLQNNGRAIVVGANVSEDRVRELLRRT